jgi:membrane fusion protein (multidrug efflux system)
MKKRMALTLLVLALVFGGIFGWKAFVGHMMRQMLAHRAMPPAAVSVTTARLTEWAPQLHSVASLSAVRGVEVSTSLAGKITRILFRSGERVRKGRLLVQIDDSSQKAQLRHDQALARLARINLKRAKRLFRHKAASRADFDTAQANYDAALAQVENDRALLRKLAVRAPFAGVLGIRKVDLGQYVNPGQALVGLQSWTPLYTDFTLPQQYLPEVRPGDRIALRVNVYPKESFTGTVQAIGSRIDPATRNFRVRARVGNPDHRLRPGMFGTVTLVRSVQHEVLVVPVTAIAYNTYGDYVYVVKKTEKAGKPALIARQHLVSVGVQRGERIEVTKGLKPGERVVSAGQIKLHNGSMVVIGGGSGVRRSDATH